MDHQHQNSKEQSIFKLEQMVIKDTQEVAEQKFKLHKSLKEYNQLQQMLPSIKKGNQVKVDISEGIGFYSNAVILNDSIAVDIDHQQFYVQMSSQETQEFIEMKKQSIDVLIKSLNEYKNLIQAYSGTFLNSQEFQNINNEVDKQSV